MLKNHRKRNETAKTIPKPLKNVVQIGCLNCQKQFQTVKKVPENCQEQNVKKKENYVEISSLFLFVYIFPNAGSFIISYVF